MTRFTYSALALTATSILATAPAEAQPEVRDHRTAPAPAASPGPAVRDHRSDSSVGRRYRRRPGPRVMMPLKVDIGAAGISTDEGIASGMNLAVGIHWASLSPRPTDTDVGIGVFGAFAAAPAGLVMEEDALIGKFGGYLEVGHTLSRGTWWRTWASGRGEYLASGVTGQDATVGFGGTGRLSAELYVSGVGLEPRGVFLGSYAIGVYVEAGLRQTAPELGQFHASMGLTFRTPLVFAL